jgi:hypothetical protein
LHGLQRVRCLHLARRCEYLIGDGGYDTLATDSLCILRRRSPLYMALFHIRTSAEQANSRAKLNFNLQYHE